MTFNRREARRLELLEPIAYGGAEGGTLRELVFYEPRAGTFEVIEQAAEGGAVTFPLLSDLTEIPVPILRTLSFEDLVIGAAVGSEVLQKKYASTAARADELGISIPKLSEVAAVESIFAETLSKIGEGIPEAEPLDRGSTRAGGIPSDT